MRILSLPDTTHRRIFLLVTVVCILFAAQGLALSADQAASPTPSATAQTSLVASPSSAASSSPSPAVTAGERWNKTVDTIKNLITALGIVIGGLWAWLKFFRGRTFRSRLELNIEGTLISAGGRNFLKATMQIKNVGLSQVTLKKGSGTQVMDVNLIMSDEVKSANALYSASWNDPSTFDVFHDHGWVEPGEEVNDELLVQLPDSKPLAVQLKLTINSAGKSWIVIEREGTRWSANTIVDCKAPNKKENPTKGVKR